MRSVTYSKYIPGLLDAINMQELLDQLSDFLLQSGFAGGPLFHPYWGEFGEGEGGRTMARLEHVRVQLP